MKKNYGFITYLFRISGMQWNKPGARIEGSIMKKMLLSLLFASIPMFILAADSRPFYAGVMGGYVMPMNMLEEWRWEARGQTADLKEEMKNGFVLGVKAGYVPSALKRMLAVELEYAYQRAEFDKIMSPGFEAGPQTIAGFYSQTTDSSIEFQSLFLNFIARYPEGKTHPYLGVGPGVTRVSVSFNEPSLTQEGFGFEESGKDTTFCCQILAGVDFDVSEHIMLGLGYRYFIAKPTMTWANGTSSDYDPVSHNFIVEMKYYF